VEDWEKKKKRPNKGVTADKPNKTINIDLCFVPGKEVHELNFSAFFRSMDESSEKSSESSEKGIRKSERGGLDIFSREVEGYDGKMDAYSLMMRNKEDKQKAKKKSDTRDMEIKADIKQREEELRAWKRKIRIERRREDEEWKKYREERIKQNFSMDRAIKDEEWARIKNERGELKAKRDKEDEEWRAKRKEIKEQLNVVITSLVAILVIVDSCTRKCLGLPVFIKGRKITADDVIKALENRLPPELKYIISDNGKQFIAEAFQRLCTNKEIVHVRITRHRPATNGIAERFVRRLKETLTERAWSDAEELIMILDDVIVEYNDAPHQGLNGLSPNEYERRLMCGASG